MMKRTGSTRDMQLILLLVPATIIIVVTGVYFNLRLISELESIQMLQPVLHYIAPLEQTLLMFDYVPLAFMLGLTLTSLYLASQIGAHPLYLPVSIIMGLFSVYMAGALSNVWMAFLSHPTIQPVTTKLPVTTQLAVHFTEIYAAIWVLLLAIQYKRGRRTRSGSRSVMQP